MATWSFYDSKKSDMTMQWFDFYHGLGIRIGKTHTIRIHSSEGLKVHILKDGFIREVTPQEWIESLRKSEGKKEGTP